MAENIQQREYDEIDLGDLLVGLWDGKWIIIGCTLIAMLIGLAYIVLPNHPVKASFEVVGIGAIEENAYTPLNRTEYVSVTRGRLLNDFVRELQLRDIIVDAARLSLPELAEEDDRQIIEFANSVTLDEPVSEDAENRYWSVKFSAPDRVVAQDLIANIVNLGNKIVQARIVQLFEQQLTFAQQSRQLSLEDLQEDRENALDDYDRRIQQRLAFLSEQAQLARTQNLGQSALLEGNTFGRNSTVTQIQADVPYYFAGYVAIEKEISTIKSRKNKEDFVSELNEIDRQIRAINQNKSVARAKIAFAATPLATENFTAVNFDPRDIRYTPTVRKSLILAGSILVGGFVGLLILVMRNALRNRKSV